MDNRLENYISHKKNFLNEEFCEKCIDELSLLTWNKHTWYNSDSGGKVGSLSGDNEPERIHSSDLLDSEWLNKFIIQRLHSEILGYIEDLKFPWFEGWAGYSPVKFIKYSSGQTMYRHCDHIQSLFDGERKGIPILSIVGFLNDDYDGGEFTMLEDKKIDAEVGDLLIFPSNFLYPHEVSPVTKGVRYSYVSWVW